MCVESETSALSLCPVQQSYSSVSSSMGVMKCDAQGGCLCLSRPSASIPVAISVSVKVMEGGVGQCC
jgi:hypothetical protein